MERKIAIAITAETVKAETVHKPYGPYERYIKRPLDFLLALGALVVLSPVLTITALLVRLKMGSPVLYSQERPGINEKLFKIYKFRTMTNLKDENGELLPDSDRLTLFGKMLRSTSLDEFPELWNIIRGDMSVIGPRPQLVRDMVFMTNKQRKRHTVRPGLSGLAQVRGRNDIDWKDKLDLDIEYINHITFLSDIKIILLTIIKVLKREGINERNKATADDYGDYLLKNNYVTQDEYDEKQKQALEIINSNISDK